MDTVEPKSEMAPKELGPDEDWSDVGEHEPEEPNVEHPEESTSTAVSHDQIDDAEDENNDPSGDGYEREGSDAEFVSAVDPTDAAKRDGYSDTDAEAFVGAKRSSAEGEAAEVNEEQAVLDGKNTNGSPEEKGNGHDVEEDAQDDEGFEDLAPDAEDAARSALAALAFNPSQEDNVIDVDPSSIPDNRFFERCDSSNENKAWTAVTTDFYGGGGGGRFNDLPRPNRHIVNIAVNSGALIDGISLLYSDGAATKYGGEGGGWVNFPLEEGEHVVGIDIKHGRFVQKLTFWTSLGRKLGPCGEGSFVLGMGRVKEVRVRAPEGHALVGVHGKSGKYIDGLGFHWAPVPM